MPSRLTLFQDEAVFSLVEQGLRPRSPPLGKERLQPSERHTVRDCIYAWCMGTLLSTLGVA